jgi:hypothetical protein
MAQSVTYDHFRSVGLGKAFFEDEDEDDGPSSIPS